MLTTLTIGGTSYDGGPSGRAAAGIFDMALTASVEDYWSLTFSVRKCGAALPFAPGQAVALATTEDDGTGLATRFAGDLQRPEVRVDDAGLLWAYSCTDLKRRADYIPVTGLDSSGTASFNLSGDDPLLLYSQVGKTVGQIVAAVLQAPGNAAPLTSAGVGNMTFDPALGTYTLPSITAADLAALSVVPASPVQLQGESVFGAVEGLVLRYQPQYASWILPDGTIRVRSIFALDVKSLAIPAGDGSGDPIDFPDVAGPDTSGCFTSWEIKGLDIQAKYLSVADGTLTPAWTHADELAWTIADFLQPRGSRDEGAVSSLTSTSCVVTSDHATAEWVANFWQGNQGWVYLDFPGGSGIDITEIRQVTSCTALTPGGSASITWDSSQPLSGSSYTRYELVGRNTPRALVGRIFDITEPGTLVGSPPYASPARGLATFVGSHLYPRFPKGAWFGNNSRGELQIFYPAAFVRWSKTGAWPWYEPAVGVTVNPQTGQVTLNEPAVAKAEQYALAGILPYRYPRSYAEGLYVDVQVCVPFNRGGLSARWPVSGEVGVAHDTYGITRPRVVHMDTFVWQGDAGRLVDLAREHLAVCQDPVYEGSVTYKGIPAAFDPFTPGIALEFAMAGGATLLDGLAMPVRSQTVHWPNEGPLLNAVTMSFSNRRRPFEADDLYVHPAFAAGTFGTQDGEILVAGSPGEAFAPMPGSNPLADAAGSNALADATSSNPLADTGNPLAGGDNPLGHVADVAPMGSGPGEGGGEEGGDFGGEMDPGPSGRRSRPRARPETPRAMPSVMDAMLSKDARATPSILDEPDAPTPELPAGIPIAGDATPVRPRTLRERRGDRAPDSTDDTTSGGGG